MKYEGRLKNSLWHFKSGLSLTKQPSAFEKQPVAVEKYGDYGYTF